MQNRSKMTYKSSKFSPAAPISSKTMSYECIPYINTVKTAPKAPKILRVFVPKQKKPPPLVLGRLKTRGGFIVIITTDVEVQHQERFPTISDRVQTSGECFETWSGSLFMPIMARLQFGLALEC